MLKNRLVTGFSVAGFFLGSFALGPYWALLILLLAVFYLAHREFHEMVEAGGLSVEAWGTFVCGLLYLVAAALETEMLRVKHPALCPTGAPIPLSEVVLWLAPPSLLALEVLRRRPEGALTRFGVSMVGFWYVAVLLSFMLRIGFGWAAPAGAPPDHTGRLALAYFVWVVKLGDVGAYAVGMLFGRGRRKLIPEISPAKSVVGLGGAYLGAVLASLVVALAAHVFGDGRLGRMPLPFGHAVVIGVLMATVGVMGDLGESLFKRSLGVKDSSQRFPGIGGFLDMLDSLLFSAPFMYLYIRWFLT
jgi:phosphatidate cytidylyltransferase